MPSYSAASSTFLISICTRCSVIESVMNASLTLSDRMSLYRPGFSSLMTGIRPYLGCSLMKCLREILSNPSEVPSQKGVSSCEWEYFEALCPVQQDRADGITCCTNSTVPQRVQAWEIPAVMCRGVKKNPHFTFYLC